MYYYHLPSLNTVTTVCFEFLLSCSSSFVRWQRSPGSSPLLVSFLKEFSHLLFFWCVCMCVCELVMFSRQKGGSFFCFLCFLPSYNIHSFIHSYLLVSSFLPSLPCLLTFTLLFVVSLLYLLVVLSLSLQFRI